MEKFTIALFGHRFISNIFDIENDITKIMTKIIQQKEYVEVLVGRNGEFDSIATARIHKLKKKNGFNNLDLILVLPYCTVEYLKNVESFEQYYDSIEVSYGASKAHPKVAIQVRNREMVDRADLIVCFLENKYGGTYKTIMYAKKQNKQIINLAVTGEKN